MNGIRLRTKFLLSMVAVSATLTFATLLVVRHTVQQQERAAIERDRRIPFPHFIISKIKENGRSSGRWRC